MKPLGVRWEARASHRFGCFVDLSEHSQVLRFIQSGVAAALCHRTPWGLPGVRASACSFTPPREEHAEARTPDNHSAADVESPTP